MRKNPRHSARFLSAVVPCIVTLGVAVGCNEPERPPAAYAGPTLASGDLSPEPVSCPPTGFVMIERQASRGRFPGALAVARLVPARKDSPRDDSSPIDWQLGAIKEEKATYWNSLFNTVSDIREVVVLDGLALEKPGADLTEIAAAARRMKADLCLIWGPGNAEPLRAALLGVIMDAELGRPVAFLQAEAGPEDFEEPPDDHFEEDRRHEDVNYLVARKFEQQVKDCMFELISRDQRIPTTLPSPWRSISTMPAADQPPIPVYVLPNRPAGW